jgi:hypothetical protein
MAEFSMIAGRNNVGESLGADRYRPSGYEPGITLRPSSGWKAGTGRWFTLDNVEEFAANLLIMAAQLREEAEREGTRL